MKSLEMMLPVLFITLLSLSETFAGLYICTQIKGFVSGEFSLIFVLIAIELQSITLYLLVSIPERFLTALTIVQPF